MTVFGFFKRQPQGFDLGALSAQWQQHSLLHDGVHGSLRIRELPSRLQRDRFPAVALAWYDRKDPAEDVTALSGQVQQALEQQGRCLLVLVHDTPDRVSWYAYAGSDKVLDAALASLGEAAAIRWGVNDDPEWNEYDHARRLVGA